MVSTAVVVVFFGRAMVVSVKDVVSTVLELSFFC